MVIACGLKALHDKADRIGGKFTFNRLREREGLGGTGRDGTEIINKTRVSRLLAILDNESEVVKWRAGVARQASKAGIEVARFEINPNGSIVVVTGKGEAAGSNPWLDDLKVARQ